MKLIVQVSNSRVTERLLSYGHLVYELKSLDAVVLDVTEPDNVRLIKGLPGVISVEEDRVGHLMPRRCIALV